VTVLPGWIDLHDHITWHFGSNGRVEDKSETPAQAALAEAGNAWVTLMAGFTTIQSVGSPEDKDLRAAINNGSLPGPRVLTALNPIEDSKLTPDQIREAVRKLKADGADVVKIFASRSIRQGGGQTLTDEQLQAACGEAKAQACVHWSMRTGPRCGRRPTPDARKWSTEPLPRRKTWMPWPRTQRFLIRRSVW